jgi:hypothetical protein
MSSAILFTRSNRRTRAVEWDTAKAVTFIVTLAATWSVTLAALEAGMSRKSAYALKRRDPAFAAAWNAALAPRQGNKVEEVDEPRFSLIQGNSATVAAARASRARRAIDTRRRDRFLTRFAILDDLLPELAPLPALP